MSAWSALRAEWRMWTEAMAFAAPGEIGSRWRSRVVRRRTGAADVVVGRGVVVAGWHNVRLSDGVRIGPGCRLDASAGVLELGPNTRLNADVHLGADFGRIQIGGDTLIGMKTVIRAANHRIDESPGVPIIEQGHVGGEVVVGDDVWIGAGVVLLPGARIGEHCVIGSGAVVTDPIPACSVAVGVPARVVRHLSAEGGR